ncbi:unnamed protein product [Sphagnum jensenii]|uniref:DNA-directed RNA polymerase subunit n=1 Tax=Sphagnum jensenii TaxID=128206 RepID=A0ABP1AML7_9BRYO
MELSVLPKMQPPDPPLAELVGIQFGMLAAKEIINFSVLEKGKSVRTPKELWDPRLGQPVEDRCATCGGRNTDECTGHFAHVDLSQPIFHPNHMRLLQHVLQKICLGCGVPLVKKKKVPSLSAGVILKPTLCDELSQVLSMEIGAKTDNVASDYWGFVELTSKSYDLDFAPPRQRDLLPFEALRILKKIPEDSIGCLGMHKSVARPEALVMERVPVPPICTRTPDMKYVSNTTSDRATRSLQTLVNEVARIRSTRSGKPTWRAGRDEFKLLQSITANYFRERGAPKVYIYVFIFSALVAEIGDDYRWTKDWFTQNILGKSGNSTARAVITGDPAIAVDEIAIPDAISRELTVPERVTRWNQKRLQDCVDRIQMLEVRRGIGANSLIRNGEFIDLHATTTKQLEVGDLVNRHLQDGDYVYVNRPPSVHKHSLMALRVVLHPGMVIAINPFICPPFGADFDGDIFHIFVPQSVEAMVELKELMTVQQQIICSQGGLPLLGLTQDTLLAAHLMTCQKVFLDKVSIDQLQMWSSAAVVPEAAILKSPKGGPLWTGEQLYSLTLPAGVDFHTLDGEVLIRNGEILKTGFSSKWLQKGRNSLIDAICDQSGPEAVVEYLNSAKGLLHAWLDSNGFSTGLTDFLVTSNAEERQSMLQRVSVDCLQRAKEQSINTLQICDAKFQLSHLSVDLEVDGAFDRLEVNPASLSNKVQMLESIAIKAFRASMAGMGNIVQESSVSRNSLFSMVKAGSTKASMSKLLDQIACMGLQLYKGEHMLPFSRVLNNSAPLESQLQEWWEDHGLVQNSLVDGLTAFQLFNHVIANRTSILRKHVEVVQPGTLFKVLMLFLRDLHVGYDGTVRSQCGQKVVQFCYGGARARHRRSRKEDPDLRWKLSYLAGEPVGVLAATALSQPAYESMLDAPHHSGWKIRPLELVQETLYPREKGDPKAVDQRAILRLTHCDCSKSSCLERRVLRVQNQLRRIILKTLAQTCIIEYWDATNERKAGVNGAALRLGSPWLGHIHISKEVLQQHELTMTKIVGKLQRKFSILRPITKKNPLGQIFFCHSEFCDVSCGLCIHFSPKLPKKMQNQYDDDEYNHSLLELMKKMRDRILPALLECTIKGDERLESVKIVQEDCTWPSWHPKTAGVVRPGEEELVLEVVATSSVQQKSKRNMAWNAVMEACVPVMEEVDWQRSMPYSIQEMKHALGIEVAYQMVVQRVALALEETAPHTYREHIKLIGDMMTYSGDANGFTFSGFRDMIKSAHISAPFTEAAYQKPIRNFLDAAAKGAMDSLESVMTSCVWGREAPLGTGTKIELRWQPLHEDLQASQIAEYMFNSTFMDINLYLLFTQSLPDYMENEEEQGIDEQAGFSPRQSPIQGDDENDPWGAVVNNTMEDNSDGTGGGWAASKADKEGRGGWGAVESGKGSGEGGSDWDTVGDDDKSCKGGGGWERTGDLQVSARKKGVDKAEGDWGAVNNECKDGGDWGAVNNECKDGGGWGAVTHSEQVSEEGGWDNVGDSKKKIPRDGHKSAGSDGKDNVGDWLRSSVKGNRKGDDQEERSWGAVHNGKGGGDTWGSMEAVQEEQGWEGELAARKEEASCSGWEGTVGSGDGWEGFGDAPSHAKTTHNNKSEKQSRDLGLLESCANSDAAGWGELSTQKDENGWGTTVATTKGSGDEDPWSSVASTGNEGDGWDAIAAGPGKSVSGEQDANDGWGAQDTPPKKLMASSGGYGQESEEASQVSWGGKEERGAESQVVNEDGWASIGTSTEAANDDGAEGGWASVGTPTQTKNSSAGDGWGSMDPISQNSAVGPFGPSNGGPTPRPPRREPECKDIDTLVRSLRSILQNLTYENGARISAQHNALVQEVVVHHPKYTEKAGCGIAYIKVDKHPNFPDTRCFWIVREDGTETDFSYHKCLKEKAAKEFPDFVEKYDTTYTGKSRGPAAAPPPPPPPPPTNL